MHPPGLPQALMLRETFTIMHERFVKTRPRAVYHYTNFSGFHGILSEPRAIWATHASFMNDESEVRHAFDLLKEVAVDADQDVIRRLTERVWERDQGAFLACFSEDGDSLSQWRAYGGDGHGFALGFRPAPMPSADELGLDADTDLGAGSLFAPVIYDDAEKRGTLAAIVDLATGRKFPEHRGDAYFQEKCLSTASSLLSTAVVLLKQRAYSDEREWRCVWSGPWMTPTGIKVPGKPWPLKFRMTSYGVAPYLEWPVTASRGSPIVDVVAGPKHSDASRRMCAEFLRREGYDSVKVRASQVSYR